jgi:hypothetical protein
MFLESMQSIMTMCVPHENHHWFLSAFRFGYDHPNQWHKFSDFNDLLPWGAHICLNEDLPNNRLLMRKEEDGSILFSVWRSQELLQIADQLIALRSIVELQTEQSKHRIANRLDFWKSVPANCEIRPTQIPDDVIQTRYWFRAAFAFGSKRPNRWIDRKMVMTLKGCPKSKYHSMRGELIPKRTTSSKPFPPLSKNTIPPVNSLLMAKFHNRLHFMVWKPINNNLI